jgi:heme-degrading monooxygenase HmoA
MIKVLIERHVVEGLEKPYEKAIAELLDTITAAPGYRGGESLRDKDHPNHYVVESNWASLAAWQRWFHSAERLQVLDSINPFLEAPEKCMILERHLYTADLN